MKLFTKYQRINLLATITIFLIASVSFYFVLHFILIDQIDDDLTIEEKEIVTYQKKYNRLPENLSVTDQIIKYYPAATRIPTIFTTEPIFDSLSKKEHNYRILYFGINSGDKNYKVSVAKSLEDTNELIQSIIAITFSTIILILAASFIINRYLLKKLWQPFYKTLSHIKDFKVSKEENISFEPSDIEEFAFMNHTLELITNKARHEYVALKTFSENAAHELQTPVAVIQSKLDLLIQDEQMTEQQSERLQSAYNAVQKLTRLNQSLLLLAKIENNQFENVSLINFKSKVEEKVSEFYEFWTAKHITVQQALEDISIKMNNDLCDILLNNLFSNATRHNIENGYIKIVLDSNEFSISNSGYAFELNSASLFSRFNHAATQYQQSNGLGLSIIKQICDVSHFEIKYSYNEALHLFSIKWLQA
ncbi:MAG: HAMP domain-containing sensor histidine kinase [Chitinophagaceae bacterium]